MGLSKKIKRKTPAADFRSINKAGYACAAGPPKFMGMPNPSVCFMVP